MAYNANHPFKRPHWPIIVSSIVRGSGALSSCWRRTNTLPCGLLNRPAKHCRKAEASMKFRTLAIVYTLYTVYSLYCGRLLLGPIKKRTNLPFVILFLLAKRFLLSKGPRHWPQRFARAHTVCSFDDFRQSFSMFFDALCPNGPSSDQSCSATCSSTFPIIVRLGLSSIIQHYQAFCKNFKTVWIDRNQLTIQIVHSLSLERGPYQIDKQKSIWLFQSIVQRLIRCWWSYRIAQWPMNHKFWCKGGSLTCSPPWKLVFGILLFWFWFASTK